MVELDLSLGKRVVSDDALYKSRESTELFAFKIVRKEFYSRTFAYIFDVASGPTGN